MKEAKTNETKESVRKTVFVKWIYRLQTLEAHRLNNERGNPAKETNSC